MIIMNRLYTVKEIADILNVSKPTVQRAINTNGIEADKEDNKHSRYYSYEKTKEIVDKINPDYIIIFEAQHTATTETFCETPKQTPEHEAQHTATPPQSEEIELVRDLVITLQEQIKIKDKQIEYYQEQIKDYSNRLKEAMALTEKQQELTQGHLYITAVDKVEQLTDTNTAENNEIIINKTASVKNNDSEQNQKKSIWQRIFNK